MKTAVVANIRLAVRADTTDPVELWLVRLRPGARPRFLTLLYDFLDYCGYGPLTVSDALDTASRDPLAMCHSVNAYVLNLPECRENRLFALSGLRSFFSRSRIFLPTNPNFDPGGKTDDWWLQCGSRNLRHGPEADIQKW